MLDSDAGLPSVRKAGAPPTLELVGVSKTYYRRSWRDVLKRSKPAETVALSDISLQIQPGEMVGLLGPNGAGKTTLLKILTGLLYPSSGSIYIDGQEQRLGRRMVKGLMGLVTCDERSFYWRLSGRQNLEFFATLYGLDKVSASKRINDLFEALGLSYAADRPYHGYSAGMKQKMAIARGLLADPRIVLYDEPTRSLDPVSSLNIRRWIQEQRLGRPDQVHLIATHLLHEAEDLCDRVIIINRGRIIEDGTINDIRDRFSESEFEDHLITYSGSVPHSALGRDPDKGLLDVTIEETSPNETVLRARTTCKGPGLSTILARLSEAGASIIRCDFREAPFDEVFASIVTSTSRQPTLQGGRSP